MHPWLYLVDMIHQLNQLYCIAYIISYNLGDSAGPSNWLKPKTQQKNRVRFQPWTYVSRHISWSACFPPMMDIKWTWTYALFCLLKFLYGFETGMKAWIPWCENNAGTIKSSIDASGAVCHVPLQMKMLTIKKMNSIGFTYTVLVQSSQENFAFLGQIVFMGAHSS